MEYWGIIIVIGILAVYYFINRTYAKIIALELMLFIEKKSDEYAITNGKDKINWVTAQYDKLTILTKSVLTRDEFQVLVQKLFDESLKKFEISD